MDINRCSGNIDKKLFLPIDLLDFLGDVARHLPFRERHSDFANFFNSEDHGQQIVLVATFH